MRRWRLVLAAAAITAAAWPDAAPEARSRPWILGEQDAAAPGGPTHHIYITALDKDGVPVKNLAQADLKVREDGSARPAI